MASSSTAPAISSTVRNTTENALIADVGNESDGWISSSTPRIVFLAVFILFGFFGNLLLIITVCHSKRFRSVTFFIFIINLAVVNICECLLNMSVLLTSSVINEWSFGKIPCRLSSFCLNLVCIITILALTISTADRLVAMRYKEKYEHVVSKPRIAVLITFTWVQAISFSFPIAIGCVPTSVNTYIVYCAISTGSSIVYNVANALLCFIIPFVLMIVLFVKIARTGYKERFLIRNIISQHNYNEDTSQEPRIKQEIRHTNINVTICVAWLVLEGPHVVTSYFNQFKNSSELDQIAEEDLKYVWYVDLVLLWLRFSYTMALPIACFTWSKELWKCFKDMILCRKNNSIIDESFKKGDSDSLKLERKIREEKMKEKESMSTPREHRVFQVPVLFATSHGVHIQTFEKDETTNNEDGDDDDDETLKSTKNGGLRGKKCDVIGSRDNLHVEEDTSDYDSGNEQDPFSVSHPISVRQIKECLTDRKRSLSEPKVSGDNVQLIQPAGKLSTQTVGSTSEGDSGLDLSISVLTNSNNSKHTFHVPSDNLLLHNTHDKLQTEIMGTGVICPSRPTNVTEIHTQNEYAKFPIQNENTKNDENILDIRDENQIKDELKNNIIKTRPVEEPVKITTRESPVPKRKKKKRKDRNFDTQSITSNTSVAGIPPRPPPRLAPIGALSSLAVNTLYPKRPESGQSSQCSFMDSNTDGRQSVLSYDSIYDVNNSGNDTTKLDAMFNDNQSISSFNNNSNVPRQFVARQPVENSDLNTFEYRQNVDNKREIKSVPEEIIHTMSDSDTDVNNCDKEMLTTDNEPRAGKVEVKHTEHELEVTDASHAQSGIRNTNARRKRREKAQTTRDILTNNSLLNENKGYQRLMPETP